MIRSKQKRIEQAAVVRRNFEHKVARYVRELIRICQQINESSSYTKMQAPTELISEMIEDCGSRLTEIEKIVAEF